MLRIGVDMLGFQHPAGRGRGISRYAEQFIAALARHDSNNEYILYYRSELATEELPLSPMPVSRWGTWTVRWVKSMEQVAHGNLDDLDLLLFTCPFSQYRLPRKPLNGPKMVAVIYDLIPFRFQEHYLSDPVGAASYYASFHALKQYDALLTISRSAKADCEEELGLPPGRVFHVGCSSRNGFFRPADKPAERIIDQRLLSELGVRSPFVLTVGGDDPRKNHAGLVEAFSRLPGPIRATHQMVVACTLNHEGGAQIRRQADELGVADRLLLTGHVSDETLRALYRGCAAFAFASHYEGFGLPILEALQCGAPVVAADNSSQPEVVGTAGLLASSYDPAALARCICRILEEPALAARLRRQALVQARRFHWRRTAQRTIGVFAHLARIGNRTAAVPQTSRSGSSVLRGYPSPDTRRRIAFFSPFPPKRSGISDYATDLLRELQGYCKIDVYHDEGYFPSLAQADSDLRIYDHRLFTRRAESLRYDAILYQMGNHLYHRFIYRALLNHPGIVTLHDANISAFHIVMALRPDAPADHLQQEFSYYPGSSREDLLQRIPWQTDPGRLIGACQEQGICLNRRLLEQSTAVVVHDEWTLSNLGAVRAANTVVIPQGACADGPLTPGQRAAVRTRFGLPAESFLVGCFGVLHPSKLLAETVSAFATLARCHAPARLILVGSDSPGSGVLDRADALGVRDRVFMLGHRPIRDFRDLARSVDLGVCLRRPPMNGETSAALLTLLGAGVPTVVTDVGTFAGYPDDVVVKVAWGDAFEAALSQTFVALARDPAARERLSRAALAHVRAHHDWSVVARLYAELIERVACAPSRTTRMAG